MEQELFKPVVQKKVPVGKEKHLKTYNKNNKIKKIKKIIINK